MMVSRTIRVLVADDDDTLRRVVCHALRRSGYEVLQPLEASKAAGTMEMLGTASSGCSADVLLRHAAMPVAIGRDESLDPRVVAAALDELVEQVYLILSACGAPGALTDHQAINQLLGLFESGSGFAARCLAEQLLRLAN